MFDIPMRHRQQIEWTRNLKILVFLAIIFYGAFAVGITLFILLFWGVSPARIVVFVLALLLILAYVFYVFLILATLVLRPFRALVTARMIKRARNAIIAQPKIKVIGIAGSYGKTTMKEFLTVLLSDKYKLLSTEGNKNTPLGISRTILGHLMYDTTLFVMEMGEYKPGDLQTLCAIAKPDIVVVTGINEAHLERMGDLDTTARAIFEAVEYSQKGSLVVLNADDDRVKEYHKDYVQGREPFFYTTLGRMNEWSDYHVENVMFHPDGSGISFKLLRMEREIGFIKIPHLAHYSIGNVVASFIIGNALGMTDEEILQRIKLVRPVKHRLHVVGSGDIITIDDSYNGNPDGAREAIHVLSQFTDRRKIYVTPGLVETGEQEEEVHREIGRQLARVADVVILVDTPVSGYIRKGLAEQGFNEKNLHLFPTPKETYDSLKSFLKEGDVVLLQNDWPDNYL